MSIKVPLLSETSLALKISWLRAWAARNLYFAQNHWLKVKNSRFNLSTFETEMLSFEYVAMLGSNV